jgi:hypothetical protein
METVVPLRRLAPATGFERNAAQHLTRADVKDICDAAQVAWDRSSRRARKVIFVWRGVRYFSILCFYQMEVYRSRDGLAVACRLHRW